MSVEGIKRTIVNTCAYEAVDEIIKDLCDRSGLDGAWHECDSETRCEIRHAWYHIVAEHIRKATGEEP